MGLYAGNFIDFGNGVRLVYDRGTGDLKITRNGTDQLGLGSSENVMVLDSAGGIGGFRSTAQVNPITQGAGNALNATGTLTAAMMLGGIVTTTSAAPVTATLDTGTLLDAAYLALFPGGAANDAFEFSVVNLGASAFTIATAAGWTNGGNAFAAVSAGASATFRVRRTAANTFTLWKIA